jgi:hypothetical protein
MLVAVIKTKSSSTSNAAKVCLFRRNAALASRVFGSTMITQLAKSREVRVFRRFVPMIGLLAVWGMVVAAAPARAQVNIDQGKSPSEIFSGDCGTCHKSAKGLANGRNAGALAGFLREHYTSSAQQASSLAAYVLGAGSGPAPTANLKPGTAGEQKTGEAKPGEKTAAHPGRPDAGENAKLQQPDQDTKIEAEPAAAEPAPAGPGRKPAAGKHEPRAVTASRGSKQGPEVPPPALQAAPVVAPETVPAPVASEPANPEPSNSEASAPAVPQPAVSQPAVSQPALPATAAAPSAAPDSAQAPNAAAQSAEATSSASAAAPAEASPSDSAPVPRDDIPD